MRDTPRQAHRFLGVMGFTLVELPVVSRRDREFTLVELLVVVAIIAVLASLLLPALGRVKENARRITCMSGLHQVMTSLLFYADDNDGSFPRGSFYAGGPSYHGTDWLCNNVFYDGGDAFFPEYLSDPRLLSCSGTGCSTRSSAWMAQYSTGPRDRSYAQNETDPNNPGGAYVGDIGYHYWAFSNVGPEHADGTRRSGYTGHPCDTDEAAVRYPVISDATQDGGSGRWLWNHYDVPPAGGWGDPNAVAAGANMAYADGRVRWYSFDQLHIAGSTSWGVPAWHGHE